MPITREELDSFHAFAVEKISNGSADLSWWEMLEAWRLKHPTEAERAEVNAIIREGLAEIEAGGGQPLDEFRKEIEQEFGFLRE